MRETEGGRGMAELTAITGSRDVAECRDGLDHRASSDSPLHPLSSFTKIRLESMDVTIFDASLAAIIYKISPPPPNKWLRLDGACTMGFLTRRRAHTLILCRCSSKYTLPPGPRAWPLIGNLNLIGPLPHHSFHKLSARYDPLMSLRFGFVPVVVSSSVDAARLILQTKDTDLIARPRTAASKFTAAYNNSSILWSPYSDYWRQGCQR
ncbi:hypothetical protein EJB05_06554, partial [Eragrostis curvula]